MGNKDKLYSDIQGYDIININDGEKYGCLFNHDLVIDEYGNFKAIMLNNKKYNNNFFGRSKGFYKVPWNSIKKIGTKTIIVDFDNMGEVQIDPYSY